MKISGGHGCFGGRTDECLKGKGMTAIPSSTKKTWETSWETRNSSQRDSPGLSKISQSDQRVCSSRRCLLCVLCLWCMRFLVPVLRFIHAICPVIRSFNAIWNLLSCSWMLDSVMCLSLANGMWTEVTGPGLKTPCLFCSIHFSSTITIRMTCPGWPAHARRMRARCSRPAPNLSTAKIPESPQWTADAWEIDVYCYMPRNLVVVCYIAVSDDRLFFSNMIILYPIMLIAVFSWRFEYISEGSIPHWTLCIS